jgi:hypothetical protein
MNTLLAFLQRFRIQILIAAVAVGMAMQFVRFIVPNFEIRNPAARQDIPWDSAETQRLWQESCGDCHSNQTEWPFYSYIAPLGWMVAYDVHEGRDELNIDQQRRVELDEMIEVIREGEMPPGQYLILHPDADLNENEKAALIGGLQLTFANRAED